MRKMRKKWRWDSILLQVAVFFAIGVMTTGIFTYAAQHILSNRNVKTHTEGLAAEIAEEVKQSVTEYPAHRWLLQYWYRNYTRMDIEYDVTYRKGTRTQEKQVLWNHKYPDIGLHYATEEEIKALPQEDQNLYAEIIYSWLITRINQIKRTYKVDFLFCVLTDDQYRTQFFLFSAADPGAVRGTEYEQVYTLGTRVTVSESQQEAMRSAREYSSHLADAGNYMDYYAFMSMVAGHPAMIGITYNLTGLITNIAIATWSGTGIAIVHQIWLSLLCLSAIAAFVIRPLKKIQTNIRLYKVTKVSEVVVQNLSRVQPRNEIGELSKDIIDLTQEIDSYTRRIETITAEKERIETELVLASRIQESMLPNEFPAFPDRSDFEIYAFMDPAKVVGGDFYDFFLLDEDHLFLSIADISGKGIPAALFMMATEIIISNFAWMGQSPAEILSSANAALCSNKEEMFVTIWIGILELSTGKVTAANAGHEYPAVMQPDGSYELLKDKHSFVVGGMEDVSYKEYEFRLLPGASLFVYTDGVPEATDEDSQMFGTDRMLETLNHDRQAGPGQVIGNIKEAVDGFVREAQQFDDLTMMCLRYNGKKEDEES